MTWRCHWAIPNGRSWLKFFLIILLLLLTIRFSMEKEMATHTSILAWRILGTGEPSGLPSTGSHRVGHDWCDSAAAADQASNSWLYCTWELSRENNLTNYLISSGCCSKIPWTRWLKQPGWGSGEGSLPGLQMAALCCVLTWQRERALCLFLFL